MITKELLQEAVEAANLAAEAGYKAPGEWAEHEGIDLGDEAINYIGAICTEVLAVALIEFGGPYEFVSRPHNLVATISSAYVLGLRAGVYAGRKETSDLLQ
jgi:hypothetical protein